MADFLRGFNINMYLCTLEKNEPDLLSDSFFLPIFFEISKIRNKTDKKRGQISMRRQFIQQRHKAGVAFSI